jgi:hypothetical protein
MTFITAQAALDNRGADAFTRSESIMAILTLRCDLKAAG